MLTALPSELLLMVLMYLSPQQMYIAAQASRKIYNVIKQYPKTTGHIKDGVFRWSSSRSACVMAYAFSDTRMLIKYAMKTGQVQLHHMCTALACRDLVDEFKHNLPANVSDEQLEHYKNVAAHRLSHETLMFLLSPKYRRHHDQLLLGRCITGKLSTLNRQFVPVYDWTSSPSIAPDSKPDKKKLIHTILRMIKCRQLDVTPQAFIYALSCCFVDTENNSYVHDIHGVIPQSLIVPVYSSLVPCQTIMRQTTVNIFVMQHLVSMFVMTTRRLHNAFDADRICQRLFSIMITLALFFDHEHAARVLCAHPMEYNTTPHLYICCITGQMGIFDLITNTASPEEIRTMFELAIDCRQLDMVRHLRKTVSPPPDLDCMLARARIPSLLQNTGISCTCARILAEANITLQSPDSTTKKPIGEILRTIDSPYIIEFTSYIRNHLRDRGFSQ